MSPSKEVDELEVLGRSGGIRATDKLESFPCPAPDEHRQYVGYFFVHGLRYMPQHADRLNALTAGEELLVMRDIQNPADPEALLLRTGDPLTPAGYARRYLAAEYRRFIEIVGAKQFRVTVERLNIDAPYDLRLLCKVESPWPHGEEPCTTGEYRALVDMQELRANDKNRQVRHVAG